jgi:CheY-like chemotaxis protein
VRTSFPDADLDEITRNHSADMETNRPSILVVDDHERFRAVLGFLLEASSFRVKLAANQQEALRFLKTEFFSLVITDYMLGAGDPERIARSLLDAAYPVPVGCLTGWSSIPRHMHGQFAFVLHKPVTAENILAAVASLFSPQRHDLRRAAVVSSYFAGLSAANWDLVASLCSEKIIFNPPPDNPLRETIHGRRLFRQYTESTFRSFPSTTFLVEGISFLPGGVVARYLACWDSDSGQKLQRRGEVLFRFDGDVILEIGVRLDLALRS